MSLIRLAPVFLQHVPSFLSTFFLVLPFCSRLFLYFPCPDPQPFLQKALVFEVENGFGNQILVVGMLIANGASLLLGLFSEQKIFVCIQTYTSILVSICV